jgi:hypothetical protein
LDKQRIGPRIGGILKSKQTTPDIGGVFFLDDRGYGNACMPARGCFARFGSICFRQPCVRGGSAMAHMTGFFVLGGDSTTMRIDD